MTHGLVHDEMNRLGVINAYKKLYSPNIASKWEHEEKDRDFVRWCRRTESRPLIGELPDMPKMRGAGLVQFLRGCIP